MLAQRSDLHDQPTAGFAAPVRGGRQPVPLLEGEDTLSQLDALLDTLEDSFDTWDGDGVFSADGKKSKVRQPGGANTTAGRGTTASNHSDWSRDGAGYFGGTANGHYHPSGSCSGAALGGGTGISQALEEQVQTLRAALETAKKKLAKSREVEGELRKKYDAKSKELRNFEEEKLAADRERRQAQKAVSEAQRAAVAKQRAAKRSKLLSTALSEEVGEEPEYVQDYAAEQNLPLWARRGRRELARFKARCRQWWVRMWPLERDVAFLEARYGSSVSVYFTFANWMCIIALVNLFIWFPLLAMQVVALASGHQPPRPPSATSLLPWEYFNYSAYRKSEALLYFFAVAAYVAWYFFASFRNVSSQLRRQIYLNIFEADTAKMRFARTIFTSWDISLLSAEAVADQRFATLSNLRAVIHEAEWRQDKAERSREATRWLYVRRGVILSLHFSLQMSAWALLIYVQIETTNIINDVQDYFDVSGTGFFVTLIELTPTVLITLVNMTMPMLSKHFAKLSKWDNPAWQRIHMVGGYYFGRTVVIVLFGLSYYQGMSALRGIAARITGLEETFEGGSNVCIQDQFSKRLLILLLTEFVLPKVSYLGIVAAKYVFVKLRKKERKKEPFQLEKNVTHLVYFQSLLWLLQPLYPLAAIYGPLLLIADFKFDKFYLLRYCNKSATPFAGREALFLVFYMLSFLIFSVFWGYLWTARRYLPVDSSVTECQHEDGVYHSPFVPADPYVETSPEINFNEAITDSNGGPTAFSTLVGILLSPAFLLVLLLLAALRVNLRGYRVNALQEYVEEKQQTLSQQVFTLQAKTKNQEKQLAAMKRQAHAMRTSLVAGSSTNLLATSNQRVR